MRRELIASTRPIRRSAQAGGTTTSESGHFRDGRSVAFVTFTGQILILMAVHSERGTWEIPVK